LKTHGEGGGEIRREKSKKYVFFGAQFIAKWTKAEREKKNVSIRVVCGKKIRTVKLLPTIGGMRDERREKTKT